MNAFSPDELGAAARRAAAIFDTFQRQLADRRVAPGCDREELRRLLAGTVGDQGIGLDAALDEFEQIILPNSMTTPHPRYLGLVNSSPLPGAVLGDFMVSMLNNNGGAYHQSPAITSAEEEVVRAFRDLLGLAETTRGMLLPGGTFANLQGLLLARTRAFPQWRRRGAAAAEGTCPRVYAAASTHFSVPRAVQVTGLGEDNLVPIRTVGRGHLDVDALARQIERDGAAGKRPCAVVATLGSTGTGAMDPLAETAAVCREHGVWLHVDACYGGAVALLDELSPRCEGLAEADSITIDPHKWFFVPIAAALFLTRHPALEDEAFGLEASYIPHHDGDAFLRGIPTSRRSSGLTLWLALRAHGWAAIRDAVRRNIAQIRLLEQLLIERGFAVLPDGEISIACARFEPPERDAAELDRLQLQITAAAVASGQTWFGTVRHDDKTWLRFNLVNGHSRDEDMRVVADLVAEIAERLATEKQ